jgi:hypothetical protein
MPIPKERLFQLIDASHEVLASLRLTREAYHEAFSQRLAEAISEPQCYERISQAFDFHQPEPSALAIIQQEYMWRLSSASRNEYRKLWMQEHRTGAVAEARGQSREEVLAQFRRENGIPDPSDVTLETLGLTPVTEANGEPSAEPSTKASAEANAAGEPQS